MYVCACIRISRSCPILSLLFTINVYFSNDLDDNLQEEEEVSGSGSKSARAVSARRRKDSYDYKSTVQMLGKMHTLTFLHLFCVN